jgi:glutamate-1-semialdehyde 2,1-aminomutase
VGTEVGRSPGGASVTYLRGVEQQLIAEYAQRTPASRALHERARKALPGGDTRTGTFFSPYPPFVARGSGDRIWDVDGNEYVDFLNNFTSLVHGHAHPDLFVAVVQQVGRGTAQAAPVDAQLQLAERLKARIPSLERVRFVNSGTEAVMQALRAARAFTGRPLIVKMEGGYHGTYDGTEVGVDPGSEPPTWPRGDADVPGLLPGAEDQVLVVPFNDLTLAERVFGAQGAEIAAVIVEPVLHNGGIIPADPAFLRGLYGLTREHGVLLVLDEIVTFRLAHGGAQQLYELRPDLTVLGKVIGGGFPVGALGGRADIMDLFDPRRADRITHSGTFNGNPVSMSAGAAALDLLTPERIAHIDQLGARLQTGFQDALDHAGVVANVTRAGSLVQIHLTGGLVRDYRAASRTDRRIRALLHLALINRGVFCGNRLNFNTSTVMTAETVDRAVAALSSAVQEMSSIFLRAAIESGNQG